jgi:hypothetical protein
MQIDFSEKQRSVFVPHPPFWATEISETPETPQVYRQFGKDLNTFRYSQAGRVSQSQGCAKFLRLAGQDLVRSSLNRSIAAIASVMSWCSCWSVFRAVSGRMC